MKPATALERAGIFLASLLLSVGLIALLSGFFAGRDAAGVSGQQAVGIQYRDLGHAHRFPGGLRPLYDSNPPTSGAHLPEAVHRQIGPLNNDQLLQALEVGNVVLAYGSATPPRALVQLASSVGGPFQPAVAAAGQAVLLTSRPGTSGVVGLAWTRMVRVSSPTNPLLRQFVQQWLGRGASGG